MAGVEVEVRHFDVVAPLHKVIHDVASGLPGSIFVVLEETLVKDYPLGGVPVRNKVEIVCMQKQPRASGKERRRKGRRTKQDACLTGTTHPCLGAGGFSSDVRKVLAFVEKESPKEQIWRTIPLGKVAQHTRGYGDLRDDERDGRQNLLRQTRVVHVPKMRCNDWGRT